MKRTSVQGFNLFDDEPRYSNVRRDRRSDRLDSPSFRESSGRASLFAPARDEGMEEKREERETRPSIAARLINCDANRTRRRRNPLAYRDAQINCIRATTRAIIFDRDLFERGGLLVALFYNNSRQILQAQRECDR